MVRMIRIGFILAISFACALAKGQEKLIFALDMIRHGDRTPLDEIPSVKYQWPEGRGQLTEKGIEQEYQLGVKLRQKYINQYGLLPENYENQTIYIHSTDTDRTLMSAQALMLGLYPERKLFPIHTQSLDQDPLVPFEKSQKVKYQIAKAHYVYTRDDWKAKEKEVQPKFKKWSQALGEEIKTLNDLKKYADTLYIHRLHKRPLPPLSAADIEEIIQTGNWAFATTYQPRAMGLFAVEMFNEISKYLTNEESTTLKYVLFSAHDSTIMCLMSLLQVPLKTHPPYASHLNFALYEDDQKQRFIKISYNDQLLKLPRCGEKGCTVEEWRKLPF